MLLVPSAWDSTDDFALIDIALIVGHIIAQCLHMETGTTLGGRDFVGPKAVFQVVVEYVELNKVVIGDER